MVEFLNQNNFREGFTDDEFKEILKMVKKKNVNLFSAYENYKIFNDKFEF